MCGAIRSGRASYPEPGDCEIGSTSVILPDWPAPANVRAACTTREGGVSEGPYASMNLSARVGDRDEHVVENRRRLAGLLNLPDEPGWLRQCHGTRVVDAPAPGTVVPEADASVGRGRGRVCAVLTADCLPVLFCDDAGSAVAAAHAGWRGLAAGVLESTVSALRVAPASLMAWLGPAIGPAAFEVGAEVREVFLEEQAESEPAFSRQGERWLADLYALARLRLSRAGLKNVYGGGYCTFDDDTRFFSYRRENQSGRMASLIWLS